MFIKPLVAMLVAALAVSPINPAAFAGPLPKVIQFEPTPTHTRVRNIDRAKLLRLMMGGGAAEEEKPEKPEVPDGEKYVPVIKMDGGIDDEMADKVVHRIEWANTDEADEIVLEINSHGGSLNSGFRIARAIEESKAPIHCVVDDTGYSMALFILQSCPVRSMTKRSTLMAHEPSVSGIEGQQGVMWNAFAMLKALSRAFGEHCASRMHISLVEYYGHVSNGKEWWMDWEEAWRVGAVDSVVKSVKAVAESYRKDGVPPPSLVK